ncbi:ClpXP protease specificity-enhancing factor [Vogesella sp. LIG4]|uniref:ClpXP protease specificity-enhancing factor n=1 Tax=Vogesella sp. LIG4 TaxID=1192162 RepID=UPI00082010CB|nr:ClpXP protease specificity-enhancing factor [Vogesella sp. LIG4]SCK09267.1 stringent starvation protein B [Vogesella sp. LIG4]
MTVSTRPYLIRALHQWCTDQGQTPYIVVWVDENVQVPMEYVKNNEIVLNVGYGATQGLQIDNEWLSFSARFGGVSREIWIPIGNVLSIFARESGEGMGFELEALPKRAEPPARPAEAVAPVAAEPVEESKGAKVITFPGRR